MPSFGDRLQREREMRSISLEEISAATKISSRNLRALEEEKFDQLPGGIFNKGFVRNYARFLGIDEERAVSDYITAENDFRRKRLKAAVDSGIVPAEELFATSADQKQESRKHSAGFRMAALILVAVLIFGSITWKLLWSGKSDAEQTSIPMHVHAQSPQPGAEPQTPDPQTPQANDLQTETSAQPLGGAPAKPPAESQPSAIAGAAASKGSPEMASPHKLNLHLKTSQDSWVQVTADGKILLQEVLASGSDRSFRASQQIVLKLGNAAGVEVSYNGKTLPSFSPDEKVKTLTFSASPASESYP